MKKVILGAAIAAIASTGAFAEDYQFEIGAGYETGDQSDVDYDGFGFYGEFHFDTVDTSKGPLNEAAFLDKSSFVRLDYSTGEADVPNAESEDETALSARVVTDSNLIVEAGYTDENGDNTILGIGVGTYLSDTMDVVVTYSTGDESEEDRLSAELHNVSDLGGGAAFSYDVGVAYIDDGLTEETGHSLWLGGDYYFNNAVSVGASFQTTSINDGDESVITIGVDYFVAPSIRLSADYKTLGQDSDGSAILLTGAVRF